MPRQVVDGEISDVPTEAARIVVMLAQQALDTPARLREIDRGLIAIHHGNDGARRFATIPDFGPVGATALAAAVPDPGQFQFGRRFPA